MKIYNKIYKIRKLYYYILLDILNKNGTRFFKK